MITSQEYREYSEASARLIAKAGVTVSKTELERMDVADFGLSRIAVEGAQILSLVETDQLALRLLAQLPGQTEPEHWHEAVGNVPGKEETLRVLMGTLLLYTEGEDTLRYGKIPEQSTPYYTCRHETVLGQNDTITLHPGKKHWFQAGVEGAVFYSISTKAIDAKDPFTDPRVVRTTVISV